MKMFKIEVAIFISEDELDEATVARHVTGLLNDSIIIDDVVACTATEVKD